MGIIVVVIAIVVIAIIKNTEKSQDIVFERDSQLWLEEKQTSWESFTSTYVSPMGLKDYYEKYRQTAEWTEMEERISAESGIPYVAAPMVGLGIAAQEGRVPYEIGHHCGLNTLECGNDSDLAIERMFMRWWDKELRMHGFPDEMIMIGAENYDNYYYGMENASATRKSYIPYIRTLEDPKLYRGQYTWLIARGGFGPATMSFRWIQSGPGEKGRWSNEHPDDRYDLIWQQNIAAEGEGEEQVGPVKRCPKCGGISFVVPATVTQNWIVDGKGERTRLKNSVVDVLNIANSDEDVWTCNSCGYAAIGAEFNVVKEIETTEEK